MSTLHDAKLIFIHFTILTSLKIQDRIRNI